MPNTRPISVESLRQLLRDDASDIAPCSAKTLAKALCVDYVFVLNHFDDKPMTSANIHALFHTLEQKVKKGSNKPWGLNERIAYSDIKKKSRLANLKTRDAKEDKEDKIYKKCPHCRTSVFISMPSSAPRFGVKMDPCPVCLGDDDHGTPCCILSCGHVCCDDCFMRLN